MKLSFDMAAVKELAEHSLQAESQRVVSAYLSNEQYWVEGAEANEFGFVSQDQIDQSKLPKALWVVVAGEIYLMSGGDPMLSLDGKTAVMAHAKGYEPDNIDNHYMGRDSVVPIPAEWVGMALEANPNAKRFAINLGKSQVSLCL